MVRIRMVPFAVLPLFAMALVPALTAQTEPASAMAGTKEFYAGYSLLSNSFDSNTFHRGPVMNGWAAAAAFPFRGRFGIKAEGLGFYGSEFGRLNVAQYFLGGGQYTRRMGRESGYVHLLAGLGVINKQALNTENLGPKSHFSVATDTGGGIDTPLSPRVAWRVEGAFMFSHFTANSDQIHGTPIFFGRFSTGIVWRF